MEFASRRVPGPLCQTKQKPAPPGHRELPPEVTEVLRRPSLPPSPAQPGHLHVYRGPSPQCPGPLRSARGSVVLPALPSQLGGHSSIQGVCAECGAPGRPGRAPPAPNCCPPLSLLAPPPNFLSVLYRRQGPSKISERWGPGPERGQNEDRPAPAWGLRRVPS